MGTKITSYINSAIRFITLQLFISCISLPLLGYWGLPQPLLSPLGNIIFAPFLTAFLLFSTLIFFAYIFCLPMYYLICALEQITSLWTYLLTRDIPTPFISCVQPPLLIAILVPLCALCVIIHPQLNSQTRAVPSLLCILLVTHIILYSAYTPKTFIHQLDCHGDKVTLIKDNDTIIVIDPGVIGKRLSASSWCEYTLISEIIKQTGKHSIDYFVCLKPGKNLFDALSLTALKMPIKHLYIPWWTNRVSPSCWRSYSILKKAVLAAKGIVHAVCAKGKSVDQTGLCIKATSEIRMYHDAQFPQLYIEGIIDNNCISIYAP